MYPWICSRVHEENIVNWSEAIVAITRPDSKNVPCLAVKRCDFLSTGSGTFWFFTRKFLSSQKHKHPVKPMWPWFSGFRIFSSSGFFLDFLNFWICVFSAADALLPPWIFRCWMDRHCIPSMFPRRSSSRDRSLRFRGPGRLGRFRWAGKLIWNGSIGTMMTLCWNWDVAERDSSWQICTSIWTMGWKNISIGDKSRRTLNIWILFCGGFWSTSTCSCRFGKFYWCCFLFDWLIDWWNFSACHFCHWIERLIDWLIDWIFLLVILAIGLNSWLIDWVSDLFLSWLFFFSGISILFLQA